MVKRRVHHCNLYSLAHLQLVALSRTAFILERDYTAIRIHICVYMTYTRKRSRPRERPRAAKLCVVVKSNQASGIGSTKKNERI